MPLDRIDGEILFDIDYNSLEQALVGTGWRSGWVVTGNASTLSVDISAGTGFANTSPKSTTASTNKTLATADPTNPRKDLIIWDTSANGLAVVTGVPQAISPSGETNPRKMKLPAPPDLTATDDILIAVVYVPAGATLGSQCTIIDKRVRCGTIFKYVNALIFSGNSPTTWTDMDLSGYVGRNIALVTLKFINQNTTFANAFRVRTNGDTIEYALYDYGDFGSSSVYRGVSQGTAAALTDSNGIIEWRADVNYSTSVYLMSFVV